MQCLLTPRFEREFHYKLQNFKKKWDQFFNEVQASKVGECINHFKSSLHEALLTIEEYNQWLDFHSKGEKNPS